MYQVDLPVAASVVILYCSRLTHTRAHGQRDIATVYIIVILRHDRAHRHNAAAYANIHRIHAHVDSTHVCIRFVMDRKRPIEEGMMTMIVKPAVLIVFAIIKTTNRPNHANQLTRTKPVYSILIFWWLNYKIPILLGQNKMRINIKNKKKFFKFLILQYTFLIIRISIVRYRWKMHSFWFVE